MGMKCLVVVKVLSDGGRVRGCNREGAGGLRWVLVRVVGSPVWPRRGREGEKHNGVGWVWSGSVGAVLCCAALRCAAVGCGGDKGEAGGRAEEWEKKGKTAKQDAGAREVLAGETGDRDGRREREREGLTGWLSVGTNANLSSLMVGNSGSGRKRMWCLS